MLGAKAVLFAALGVIAAVFLAVWVAGVRRARCAGGTGVPAGGPAAAAGDPATAAGTPTPLQGAIGFVVTFFDTLGIGSFATTTSIFKLRRVVPDRLIPGTLNVGLALPGAWLGAGVVASWPRRYVQIGMGIALLLAAALMLATQLKLFPAGGDALGVTGLRLAIGLLGNFALGALMTLGIGLYAPCMILVSLLGMNPTVAFPIMMGSCAFLMPVGSIRFIQKRSYALRPAIGLTLGGIPAVLLAAFVVRSLPLGAVRWLVVCVVLYTAAAMLRSARAGRTDEPLAEALPPAPPAAPALEPTELA